MRAASPPRSPRSQCALKRGVPRCAAPLLLLAAWLGGCSAADPPVDTTVSGGSNEATGDAGALTYTKQGTTASGAPYYKADGSSFWLYWDPDCDGRGRPPLWILKFDDNAPSTTASSDLDEDSECQFSAYIRSADSSSPPHGRFAWRVHRGGRVFTDTDVTILALGSCELAQYAIAGTASSAYNPDPGEWSVAQATGPPSYYGCAVMQELSWAPADNNKDENTLTLNFSTLVYAEGVRLWEHANPASASGIVKRVDVIGEDDAENLVWDGTDSTLCGGVLT